MAFLAYVAILLVSISGILLELNWLTQPKLEAKPTMHAMSAPPAPVRRVVAKVDRPNAERNPVYPKQAAAPQVIGAPQAIDVSAEAPKAATAAAVAEVPMPPARPQEAEQVNAGDPPPAAAAQPPAIANAAPAEKGQRNGEAPVRRRRLRRRLHFVPGIGLHLSAFRRSAAPLRRAACLTATLGRARAAAGSFAARPRRALFRSRRRLARAAALERFGIGADDGDGPDGPPRPPRGVIMIERGYGRWP